MDILKNKLLKEYDRLSRYSTFPVYYNTLDEKYQYGTTNWLDRATDYETYTVKVGDSLDSIALAFYKNPTYYWVICDFNRLTDPFVQLKAGALIRIPVLSNIEFLTE